MKRVCIILGLLLIFGCKQVSKNINSIDYNNITKIEKIEFHKILQTANVKGSVLIYDPEKRIIYSNDFKWCSRGFLPASTFKIPNSIIALETGVIDNDSTIIPWNGEKRGLAIWDHDLYFKDAFQLSCVPCYQDIARKIGYKRMNDYLNKLKFGEMKFDSLTIDKFWLEGDSKINQYQMLDFLYRLYYSKLPVSQRTVEIIKRLMFIEDTDLGKLSGKTGWAIRNNNNTGWFAGYLELKNKTYFVVTNVIPNENFNLEFFAKIRKVITLSALKSIANQ